ncbi:MAG: diaminopimelate decarboxylase [Alphaproteobacteria bacterium]|nr:diaminopimelate decarboxylase [Alphaproteobacteria bacterium]
MNHFEYINGILHAEGVSIADIANSVGTPFYCYSSATIERHFKVFSDAFKGMNALVCYAVKANSNLSVLKTLANLGAGADVVSAGEMHLAVKAGIPANKIVFSGVGKTRYELGLALELGIKQINVESAQELEVLNDMACQLGKRAPIAFRVNLDVADAGGHDKISTGSKENKFGIEKEYAKELYRKAAIMSGIDVRGVDLHIGSQITELEPFKEAFDRLRIFVMNLKGEGVTVNSIDIGGGLGVQYEEILPPSPKEYADIVKEYFGDLNCEIILEPGRLIMANAGVLVSKATYIKKGTVRTFVVVDAAMNDLVRPALYDAWHDISLVEQPKEEEGLIPYDVVGPICESGDIFAKDRPLPPINAGDLLVFDSAGAYGSSMASTYNVRPLVPEVMVKGDKFAVIRRRPNYEEMLQLESLPDWLE